MLLALGPRWNVASTRSRNYPLIHQHKQSHPCTEAVIQCPLACVTLELLFIITSCFRSLFITNDWSVCLILNAWDNLCRESHLRMSAAAWHKSVSRDCRVNMQLDQQNGLWYILYMYTEWYRLPTGHVQQGCVITWGLIYRDRVTDYAESLIAIAMQSTFLLKIFSQHDLMFSMDFTRVKDCIAS